MQAAESIRKMRAYPAPAELATVTDLRPEEAEAVTNAVNPLIADAFVLYVKTKNFHWHLYGPRFRDLHLLFDEHADAILESVDVMAERVRRVGGTTIRSIGHIAQLQTIMDDNNSVLDAQSMVRQLCDDNAHIAKMIRDAIAVCDRSRDSATSNSLQEILDQTERRKWFLFEILQGSK
jgi:starvation-inducible DNA-binding protein